MAITIYPAIDLQQGRCVRLRQGRAEELTVYGEDPLAMARHWLAEGARALHVVDLDGAFQGKPAHAEVISQIAAALPIPVQIGGGLRSDADAERMLASGVKRVILGTRALDDSAALERLVKRYGGERIAVGIDARDGWVQIKGWVETTRVRAIELAQRVEALGVGTIIYTDTATDGMLSGPNLPAMRELCLNLSCTVIASGGVSRLEDIEALVALEAPNLHGAIVGKALYDGRVTLAALNAAGG